MTDANSTSDKESPSCSWGVFNFYSHLGNDSSIFESTEEFTLNRRSV